MICSHCGTALPVGALFCGECGRPVQGRTSEPRGAAASPAGTAAPATEANGLADLVAPTPSGPVVWPSTPVESAREHESEAHEVAPADEVRAAEAAEIDDRGVADEAPSGESPFVASASFESSAPLSPEPADESRGAGWCAQCGALLSASDIFCGECGFVRSPVGRPRDTEILDPFPWGLSSSAPIAAEPSVPAPAATPREAEPPAPSAGAVAAPEPDEGDDAFDDTRIVAPGARGDRFILQFSTGESVTVTGSGLLGRNPVAEPGEYFDALVTVSDPGRSVSKTHLEFGQEGGSFWISDRYSGNGTVFREPERTARRCDPGKRYRVARGTRVEIGEQFFILS